MEGFGPSAAAGGPDDVAGPRKRRWPRRLIIGTNITLIVVIIGAALGYTYLHYRLNQIKKVAVAGEAQAGGGQPLTILVAGSDSRAGESAGAAAHFGSTSQVAGQRSDVILLVHINPSTDSASMLSIPRDTAVTIAGTQSVQKINVAFNNGPSQLVQTLTATFGIRINHVAQVTFTGVMDVDNAVGGVCMNFPYPARDGSPTGYGSESGLNIPTAGRHVLNGDQALALIRSRYYQYYKNGEWIPEGTGDIGRIIRQHTFLRAMASKALHEAVSNPLTANRLATDAVHDVTVDNGFSSNDILGLLAEMRNLHPSGIPSWTLPTTQAYSYSLGDYLVPEPSADQAVIQQWLNYRAPSSKPAPAAKRPSTPTTIPPSSVTVAVRNGSGKASQAGTAAAGLRADGFNVSGTGDAPNFQYASSEVDYGKGADAQAQAVAADILGGAKVVSNQALPSGGVELITGASFTGIKSIPAPTTTTTAPASGSASSSGLESVPPWDPTPCT
ncbi:MAG TPA: LCP family protein [Acidimicrobiales bacterium]|nr:LCP family protein [Acidimicrobiales bacterium]